MTGGEDRESRASKSRPLVTGMPYAANHCGVIESKVGIRAASAGGAVPGRLTR